MDKQLSLILSDLKKLFAKDEILAKDFNDFCDKMESKEVENYLKSLSKGSKPEQALREIFFSFNSKFAQYLFTDIFPEVSNESGFIDYLIKANREEIALEIKPLFTAVFKKTSGIKQLVKIKKSSLNPEIHRPQVLKYLREARDFVVLTNLEDWFFFSRGSSLKESCPPFGQMELFSLLEEAKQLEDFWHFLDNTEDLSIKEPLDEQFFKCLKFWVSEINMVKFNINDNLKISFIINLINKFIFIQSLDSFWVIGKQHIQKEWDNIERKWSAKNPQRILKKYLEDINEYFYEYYDTELFKISEQDKTILDYIDLTESNVNLFYKKFKLILGIDFGINPDNWIPGITQFNFRRIDEDILGKSYETFLAEVRKEQGIYYTPKYITKFIANHTVSVKFDEITDSIPNLLENGAYEKVKKLILEMFDLKVLDPACGSGSFLIKALKVIWEKYKDVNHSIEQQYSKYSKFSKGIERPKEVENKFGHLLELKNLLGFSNQRRLISQIILRHIYGIDLDKNALDVAKLNIWLESIKLAPSEFQANRVPADTNHILPDLEMNLYNGDSLIGHNSEIIDHLKTNSSEEIKKLSMLRKEYIKNPQNNDLIRDIILTKQKLGLDLDSEFGNYVKSLKMKNDIYESTIPFHWQLDFWFIYLNENVEKNPDPGFDCIIGNPPYFTIRGKGSGTITQSYIYEYLQKSSEWKDYFRSQSDIYYYFIIKSALNLRRKGKFGFIIESYWLENDYADKLKALILDKVNIDILINFGKVKKIFEDADNDTCILLFTLETLENMKFKYIRCIDNFTGGTQHQNNQKMINHIISNIEKNDFSDKYIDIYLINQSQLDTSKWVLSKEWKRTILEKITSNSKPLGELCEIGQGMVPGRKTEFRISSKSNQTGSGGYITRMDSNFIEVVNKINGKTYKLEREFVKPLVTNSDLKKYQIVVSGDYLLYTVPLQEKRIDMKKASGVLAYLENYKEKLKERYDYDGKKYPWYGYQRIQNVEIFEFDRLKILCPYRAPENSFALDSMKSICTTDMYALIPDTNTIDFYYLLGVLNSKLLTFWYKEAGKAKGLILEFFATPLSKMPILISERERTNILRKKVSSVITLKSLGLKFNQIWLQVSEKYQSKTISFKKLILDDRNRIQRGNFSELWIEDIDINPNSNSELLTKKFDKIEVKIINEMKIIVLGLSGREEQILLKLTTSKREYTLILYLELKKILKSRRKIDNLSNLFEKTEIPVITPNIWEHSHNLINYTNERYIKEVKTKIEEFNMFTNDKKIASLENEIDVLVFKYYDIPKEMAELILDSIETTNAVKLEILEGYENIK